ncbi:hypothetical protein AMTRI_Chr12g273330 [Amborella trichopoda]
MVIMESLAPRELCPMEWSTLVKCAPWDVVVLMDWCNISSNGMEHSSEMCPVPHRMVLMETLAPMEWSTPVNCATCPIGCELCPMGCGGSDGLVQWNRALQ